MTSFTNRTAFITGGASGIGRALCLALSARGANIRVADIDLAAAQSVASACGAGAHAVKVDVRDAAALKQAIESFANDHGRLDYIFNNAGIGVAGETDEIPMAEWQRIVDINLYGVLNG
ncbi:MAG: hypothetical protein RL625_238, partial [Gemmatimonadota bacterium]